MKKVFMTLAAVLMGMTAANAQLVIGGSINLGGSTGDKLMEDGILMRKQPDQFNFGFSPKVGYLLMDGKMEVGAALNLNYNLTTNYGDVPTFNEDNSVIGYSQILGSNHKSALKTSKYETLSLSVSPYVRYYFLQKGIFSLGIQGVIGLGGSFVMPSTVYAYEGEIRVFDPKEKEYTFEEVKLTQEDADKQNKKAKESCKDEQHHLFNYGIYVMPVMKFDINEHWYVDVALNALGLYMDGNVYSYKSKDLKGEYTIQNKNTYFDGGFSAMSGSAVTVGFAYKF